MIKLEKLVLNKNLLVNKEDKKVIINAEGGRYGYFDFSKETIQETEIPKNDNPPKEIVYEWEYGMLVGLCPNCWDIPYDKEVCQLCGQKLIWKEKPKKYQDIVVKKGDYVITQIYGSWSIYVEKNGVLISTSVCNKKLTKKELLKFARKKSKLENKY